MSASDEEIMEAFGLPDTPEVRKEIDIKRTSLIGHGGLNKENLEKYFPDWPGKDLVGHRAGQGSANHTKEVPFPGNRDGAQKTFQWTSELDRLRRAPFRFVPLDEDDRISLADRTPLNRPIQDGFCVQMSITIRFDTPFLIGARDGDVEAPFRLGGKFAIPGSSLRGWLRSTVESLVFARLVQVNADQKFPPKNRGGSRNKGDKQAPSIGDKLPAHSRALRVDGEYKADIADALFGYVYESDELESLTADKSTGEMHKGRIAVGFARPTDESKFGLWPGGPIETIQGEAKPSFAPFYLVGEQKDWSEPHARLAGRKRYLPRAEDFSGQPGKALKARQSILEMMQDQVAEFIAANRKPPSEKITSKLQFLKPADDEAAFSFRIRLHNVSEAEIGCILWALTWGGDGALRHMIGRGKPFGAGQFRVDAIEGEATPNVADPTPVAIDWRRGEEAPFVTAAMAAFEGDIERRLGLEAGGWRRTAPVKAALDLARPVGWSDKAFTYLAFGANGKDFKTLRNAAGPGAVGAPWRLLPAGGAKT